MVYQLSDRRCPAGRPWRTSRNASRTNSCSSPTSNLKTWPRQCQQLTPSCSSTRTTR
uniref:Uncharacterized protein n=1 Tax=Anguilla anguilla TaxID=7936 RepID=A0A0E9SVW8_ANGAN